MAQQQFSSLARAGSIRLLKRAREEDVSPNNALAARGPLVGGVSIVYR